MRNYPHIIGLAVLCATLAGAAPGHAEKLPSRLSYRFMVEGKPAGRADIVVRQQPGELVLESKTHVVLTGETIDLTCKTVADPTTYVVRSFSLKGTRAGNPVASSLDVYPDSIVGWMGTGDSRVERRRKGRSNTAFIFEDWIMELQILLALRQEHAPPVGGRYRLTFGGSFLPAEMLAAYTGSTLVESGTRSVAAKKLEVAIAGGSAFESQVDPQTGLPLVILFPTVKTEAYREDFFGEKYITRFPATDKPVKDGAITARPGGR